MKLSSVGVGTYIGAPDDGTDFHMYDGIKASVLSGAVNVIDTAINYRYMKSERTVGKVLKTLVDKYKYQRDELFVSSKIGYIPEDADQGIPGRVLINDLIAQGDMTEDDVCAKVLHCMHPSYLQQQLKLSLRNLGLSSLDLMYLHNAMESQGPLIGEAKFMERLGKAFEWFEAKVQEGKIKNYGMATWICFRAKQQEKDLFLSLEEVVRLAEKVGGTDHHFKYIQFPINTMMPEAFIEPWQPVKSKEGVTEMVPTITAARNLGINFIISQPLMQGHLLRLDLPNHFNVRPTSCRHIQLARSIPTNANISVMVGMKQLRHVNENLKVAEVKPLEVDELMDALSPDNKREPYHEIGINESEGLK